MGFLKRLFTPQEPIASAPAVGPWGHFWRIGFGVAFGLLVFAISANEPMYRRWPTILVAFCELTGLAGALYLYAHRRTLPMATAILAPILGAISLSSSGFVALASFSVATRGKWREISTNAASFLLFGAVEWLVNPIPLFGSSSSTIFDISLQLLLFCIVLVPLMAAFYGIALAVGSTREKRAARHAWFLSEQRLHTSRVQEIRALERGAIAREMHDVLAHRISMVALHSGALAYRTDMEPEQVRETAQLINDSARLALKELREVLGTLRHSELDEAEAEAPQPTLAQLPQLWEEANIAVAPVSVVWHGLTPDSVGELQESTSRNAYRVVQESLTNARKHAPGVPVQVDIARHDPRLLNISVVNRMLPHRVGEMLPTPGDQLSGFGLIGMAERVRSSGGTITAGPQGELFVVNVSLPWIPKDQGL